MSRVLHGVPQFSNEPFLNLTSPRAETDTSKMMKIPTNDAASDAA